MGILAHLELIQRVYFQQQLQMLVTPVIAQGSGIPTMVVTHVRLCVGQGNQMKHAHDVNVLLNFQALNVNANIKPSC
jgi:hypothetical protein